MQEIHFKVWLESKDEFQNWDDFYSLCLWSNATEAKYNWSIRTERHLIFCGQNWRWSLRKYRLKNSVLRNRVWMQWTNESQRELDVMQLLLHFCLLIQNTVRPIEYQCCIRNCRSWISWIGIAKANAMFALCWWNCCKINYFRNGKKPRLLYGASRSS